MKVIENILLRIEHCISRNVYIKLENEKIELKDNSHDSSQWNEVFKTVNAFLNTNGGIVILGLYEDERNKKFVFKGFDFRNEEKVKTLNKAYTDDNGVIRDLGENIKYEVKEFMGGQVLVIYVDALADDEKYVYFKNESYERLITGDHRISEIKIQSQKEYKAELINIRELQPVANSSLDDLDVNKLNDYIHLLNSEIKSENIKASIEEAKSFLLRNGMIRENVPTILGILACGSDPEEKLHWRSQVDAYVDVPGSENITQNKKIINSTVLDLMEQSVAFINRNIQTGISNERGGTKTFEYPERLIRECVNNSLAHRDYSIDKYININIIPSKHLQIRNPGRFKQQLLIHDLTDEIPVRRIIAGNPKANNPKLAKVLSVYNKWEGKGWGMATVIGACLENKIDIPYYIFHSWDELSLFIPKGTLVDETMETLFESYSGYINKQLRVSDVSEEQKRILTYIYKSEILNKQDRYTILLTKDNNHLQAIQSLEEAKLIYRHKVSDEISPVFVVDRNLFKSNFFNELKGIFGNDYEPLPQDYKDVLSFIYERNNYSLKRFPSANEIGGKLWVKKGNANILDGYEVYKRKIRNVVNQLEKKGFVVRNDSKPEYVINGAYKRDKDLFDE